MGYLHLQAPLSQYAPNTYPHVPRSPQKQTTVYRVPLAAITYPLLLLHGPRNIPPLRHIVFNEAIKCFVGALTPREVKAIMPTSADTYVKFCGDEKLPVVIEDIGGEEGQADRDAPVARLLWVGPRWESEESNTRQRKVLLYIHGGGFEMPLDRAHLNFVSWLQHRRPENDDLSIAFLEYSLTPRHQYPTQLRQCAAAVGHLMKRGLRPENVSFFF